jgi:cytochrome P450
MQRNAKQKFTFSDGTIIPAGAKIGTASLILHRDQTAYEDGDAFDGFRFSKKGEAASSSREAAKFSMVNTAAEYQIFGHGKHAW